MRQIVNAELNLHITDRKSTVLLQIPESSYSTIDKSEVRIFVQLFNECQNIFVIGVIGVFERILIETFE